VLDFVYLRFWYVNPLEQVLAGAPSHHKCEGAPHRLILFVTSTSTDNTHLWLYAAVCAPEDGCK
jgi:hypothetical protein